MSINDEAEQLIQGDRREAYGPVTESFQRIANVWTGILQHRLKSNITAKEVALLMGGLKLCREANSPKRDNRVDGVAYWDLADILEAEASGKKQS